MYPSDVRNKRGGLKTTRPPLLFFCLLRPKIGWHKKVVTAINTGYYKIIQRTQEARQNDNVRA